MSVDAPSVDEDNPWLGLASFTEATRVFFFGREAEVAELERRVQRKLLTVLFGKSGLGKTSILQAGLVPQLRGAGYFPVYLRIDYGKDAPEPSEQIKQAIGRAASAGHWTHTAGVAAEESIWEFLHHRDAVLKDRAGSTLIPLLIFDQFEELFTLAQSDEFLGRARAARFIEELADLVENRPPQALEAKFEDDENAAERFDFARSDYRVVISLREDYLAPLESLKKSMPSLSQNRLRLAPMTGSQGLEAVQRPGKDLVCEEVAAAIVRFVAGGAELANAEVEPSLLSLICRELNEQRLAQHRAEISLDLLAGSHESILSSFYERSLADQPASVRRIIEDELLTDSGYRENLAEERVLRRLQVAGASPDALGVLVNRRLLRIEERLDVRRVELTHDVLTGVVKASRDQRQEREAREATDELLAEQSAREHAAQRALRRARAIAAGCTALAALAVVAAVLAFVNVQRARRAEADAQDPVLSEQGRSQAQHLLGFLTDDFVQELASFGRYQTILDLSQREIDYFKALPPKLKDGQTVRDGALAYANYAGASMYLGDTLKGIQSATAGIGLLDGLRRAGDRSEATTIALARVYISLSKLRANQVSPEEFTDLTRAADLLRPIAAKSGASPAVRRAYMEVLVSRGAAGVGNNRNEDAVRTEREAQRLVLQLGARKRGDLVLDADYVIAGSWLTDALVNLTRSDEARRAGEDALQVIDRILAQRPQYGEIVLAKQMTESALSSAASEDLDAAEAARRAIQSEQTSLELVALEPANKFYLTELGTAYAQVGATQWLAARLREAIVNYRKAVNVYGELSTSATFFVVNLNDQMHYTVVSQAQLGDAAGAAATLAAADAFTKQLHLGDTFPAGWVNALRAYLTATLAYERDDFGSARRIADEARVRWLPARTDGGPFQTAMKNYALYHLSDTEAQSEYRLGHFAAAAQLERTALQACSADVGLATRPRDVSQARTWLAMALAGAGQQAQAAQIIGPVATEYRALEKRNHGDEWLPLELAQTLYAQSLTDARQAPILLREAAQLVDHLPPTIAALHDTQQWRTDIDKARSHAAQR